MSVQLEAKRGRGRPSVTDASLPSDNQLMETALAVFAREGYEGTSMRGLARQLGVSHNFLSSRYGSKDDFWRKVVAYGCAALERELAKQQEAIETSDLPVQDRLRAVFRMYLAGLPMMSQIQQLMIGEGSDKSERLDYIFECFSVDLSFLEGLLEQGNREGIFRDLDVPVTVLLLNLMQNAQSALSLKPLAPYLYGKQVPADEVLIESVLDIVMAGIMGPGAGGESGHSVIED